MGFEGVPLLDPDQAERTDIRLATTAPRRDPEQPPDRLVGLSPARDDRAVAAEFCLVATHEFLCEAVIMLIQLRKSTVISTGKAACSVAIFFIGSRLLLCR